MLLSQIGSTLVDRFFLRHEPPSWLRRYAWCAFWTLLAGLVALPSQAAADTYPSKPLRIVVGYVPGGAPDVVARAVAQSLQKSLKQTVVVENRPGAGGVTATDAVAHSAADGYTLLLGETGQLVIAPYTKKKLPYDTLKDLAPIAFIATTPLAFVSNPGWLEVKSFGDFVRESRRRPLAVNYGSSGIGSIHQIATEVLAADLDIRVSHVPYKGSGASIPALLGGEVPILMTSLTAALPLIQSGKINLLAVTTATRFPGTPQTPAVSEFIKGYDYPSEIGILAPAGLPPSILEKLSSALKQAMASEDVKTRLEAQSILPTWSTPAAYRDNIAQNLKKYEKATKTANLQPE